MKREDLAAMTKKDLVDLARKAGIQGRSALSKGDLIRALLKGASSGAAPRPSGEAKPPRARRGMKEKDAERATERGGRAPHALAQREAREVRDEPARHASHGEERRRHELPREERPRDREPRETRETQRPQPPAERPSQPPSQPPQPADIDDDRQPPELARRGAFGEDPGMKLSRVEEIRKSHPGRRHGPRSRNETDSRGMRSGPQKRGGPQGRDMRGGPSFGQHAGRPAGGGPQDPRQPQHREHGRDRDRDRGGRDRNRGRDQGVDRGRDRGGDRDRGPGFQRREDHGPGRRFERGDARAHQAREQLRRTGDARRQSPYTPQFERDREGRRFGPPPGGGPQGQRPPGSAAFAPGPHSGRPSRPHERGAHRPGGPPALPESYGRDRLVLMARDPYWLHAYWEVIPATVTRALQDLGSEAEGHRWILRMHSYEDPASDRGAQHFDVEIQQGARNWYLRVPEPDRVYGATIGLLTRDGALYPFARSERVRTPRATPSPVVDPAGSAQASRAERIVTLSGGQPPPSSPGLVVSGAAAAIPTSGPLVEVSSGPAELRPTSAPLSGAESLERPSSQGVAPSAAAPSGTERPAAPSSQAPSPPAAEAFPLRVRTDLILYGTTRPDAKLTVQGRPVGVRPDGTFSVRFELPDGEQTVPCVARGPDNTILAQVTASVGRRTKVSAPDLAADPQREG